MDVHLDESSFWEFNNCSSLNIDTEVRLSHLLMLRICFCHTTVFSVIFCIILKSPSINFFLGQTHMCSHK